MTDLSLAISLIAQNTLVLVFGDSVIKSEERGVLPLLKLIESGVDYSKYSAADKVVGRAAALLYVKLGIQNVYAEVLSEGALSVFNRYGVAVKYKVLAKKIINRQGTDICPMEQAVQFIDEPEAAIVAIEERLEKLKAN